MRKIAPYLLLIGLFFQIPPGLDWSLFSHPEAFRSVFKADAMMAILIYFVYACIASWLWKHNKAFSLFYILAIVMSIQPVYRGPLYEPLACLTAYTIWYLYWVRSDFTFNDICNSVCAVGLLQAALTISQYYLYDPIFHLEQQSFPYRTGGFFNNINFGSAMIAICLPAFFMGRWKILIPVMVYGLIITVSTGGFLAATFSCMVGGIVYYKNSIKSVLIVAIAAGAVFGYTYIDSPGLGRAKDWKAFLTLNRIEHKKYDYGEFSPGLGLGSFNEAGVGSGRQIYTHAHNDWLEGFIDLGWPVIPIYIIFFIQLYTMFRQNIISSMGLVASSVVASVIYPMSTATTAAIILVWLAMRDRKANG